MIDIGAHTGDTTIPMALAAGPTGCTLALEPNPHVFKILEENSQLNPDKVNIDPQCWAATEEDGEFVFHYTDASFVNGGFKTAQKWPLFRRQHPLTVEGRNLENVLHEEYSEWLHKLTYVKVDAEGYDKKILQSIRTVLEDTRPVIRTEVFRKLMSSERLELFDLLADIDYEVYHYEEAEEIQGRRLEPRRHESREALRHSGCPSRPSDASCRLGFRQNRLAISAGRRLSSSER